MSNTIRISIKAPNSIDSALHYHFGDDPDRLEEIRNHFFKYGEYCEIELDLTTMTGKVVPVK